LDSTINTLNIRCLEAFTRIIQTGSATAAAKQLGLTQPGISRLLAQFETHVGFQLFYREKGRLIATDEALALVKEVDLAISSMERISLLAKNMFNANTGMLKIVAPNSFIAGPLADAITDFLRQYPKVNISLESHNPSRAREIVALRSVDCGFIQLPETHPGLVTKPLVTSRAVCALSSQHPLANKKKISFKELSDHDLILLGRGRFSRMQIDSAFERENASMKVKIEAHTVATACTFAKRNMGIAIVNELLAEQYVDSDMVLIPLTSTITYEFGFITSAHAPMSRLTERFYQFCEDYFSKEH